MRQVNSDLTSGLDTVINLISRPGGATTGLSRYGRELINALGELGILINVVPAKAPPFTRTLNKVTRKIGFDLGSFFNTYPVWLNSVPPDSITHLTSQNLASAVAFKAPKHLIITAHDLITFAFRNKPEFTGYLKSYDRIFDNLAVHGLKKASFLIAVSENTRQDLIRFTSYPGERIKVIYEGVDHKKFYQKPLSPDFYQRYSLEEVPYLLYVGSEDPRKNLKRLIEAFAQVIEKVPEARLLKVGAARFQQERQHLLDYIDRLGLTSKIKFVDQVSDDDLSYFYNLASVFVFPSLYEGFGLPVLEAMACGTPVICSNTSSLPEIVGEAAITINPYSVDEIATALELVLSDSALRETLRQGGLERASQFTWEKTAQETIEVYKKVLEQN